MASKSVLEAPTIPVNLDADILAAASGIDREDAIAAFGEIFHYKHAWAIVARARADDRDVLHGVEEAADVAVVVTVVVHRVPAATRRRISGLPTSDRVSR